MTRHPRAVIAEDESVLRIGLRDALVDLWPDLQVCALAEDGLKALRALARKGPITLVYGAHDETHNDAVVLRNVLLGR